MAVPRCYSLKPQMRIRRPQPPHNRRATGGTPHVPATWTLLENLITPHPLGGCNMGAAPENGVVNHLGEVFGYPRLYVADGAIVPRPIGLNPSRTIAALAERIAERKTTQNRHSFHWMLGGTP